MLDWSKVSRCLSSVCRLSWHQRKWDRGSFRIAADGDCNGMSLLSAELNVSLRLGHLLEKCLNCSEAGRNRRERARWVFERLACKTSIPKASSRRGSNMVLEFASWGKQARPLTVLLLLLGKFGHMLSHEKLHTLLRDNNNMEWKSCITVRWSVSLRTASEGLRMY